MQAKKITLLFWITLISITIFVIPYFIESLDKGLIIPYSIKTEYNRMASISWQIKDNVELKSLDIKIINDYFKTMEYQDLFPQLYSTEVNKEVKSHLFEIFQNKDERKLILYIAYTNNKFSEIEIKDILYKTINYFYKKIGEFIDT